jgi:hypothetical protein
MLRVVLQVHWCEGIGCDALVFAAMSMRLLAMCGGKSKTISVSTYMEE